MGMVIKTVVLESNFAMFTKRFENIYIYFTVDIPLRMDYLKKII